MNETLQHLILVRHGESEGDVRREAWRRGQPLVSSKSPEDEELTARGYEQSEASGAWLNKHLLLGGWALQSFDLCYVSSVLRTEQAALAMNLHDALWQEDERLNERNRGLVRGLTKEQHNLQFPKSYKDMLSDPLHWTPPGGESILDVISKLSDFYEDMHSVRSIVASGHRDSMWASMAPLEGLDVQALAQINTGEITNGQIWHYTSIDPQTGRQAAKLMWKRIINPLSPEPSIGWQILTHAIAEKTEPGNTSSQFLP